MTATNKPMTGAQLDELMAVAMRMQSDSEKMGDRSVSMFAYAVQVAVLEIRETRCMYEELQSQNADMAVQLANAESKFRELAAVVAENAALKTAAKETLAHWAAAEAGEMELMMDKCMPALVMPTAKPQRPTLSWLKCGPVELTRWRWNIANLQIRMVAPATCRAVTT
ncbi:TPA: hypothetical protein ACT2RL_004270 [Citrobacter braakii]